MRRRGAGLLACPLVLFCFSHHGSAQDLRSVKSPDGRLELRLFIAPQMGTGLFRLAWSVDLDHRPVLLPAFLGLDILDQEPILGENVGLISESTRPGSDCTMLFARYLQNGSTGRSLDLEARVYNDGLAFRYKIPRSPLLDGDVIVNADLTEFRPAGLTLATPAPLPFVFRQNDSRWIEISESSPHLSFTPLNATTLIGTDRYTARTPLTTPWHVLAIASEPARLPQTTVLKDLPRSPTP